MNSNSSEIVAGSESPDPDVAGPGVMIGFIVTGLLATMSSNIASFLRSLGDDEYKLWLNHPSWRARLLRQLRRVSPTDTEDPVTFWKPILEDFVLNLSDQQLITGLLLITLAFPKYFFKNSSSLTIAADLGVFSMITHFATILTIRPMLRDHFKLAVLRMAMVFATMILWLVISLTLLIEGFKGISSGGTDVVGIFAIISSFLEILGIPWVFWDICLHLFLTESTLKARRAISIRAMPEPADRETITDWVGKYQEDNDTPRGFWSHVGFAFKKPLSWLFEKFCRRYVAQNSGFQQRLLWILAEVIFPFRFGNIMQDILLVIGIVNVSLDLTLSGLTSSWGFGQLLPTFMLLLPFFSLAEAYAKSALEITRQKEDELQAQLDHLAEPQVGTPPTLGQQHDVVDAIEMRDFAVPERIHDGTLQDPRQNRPAAEGDLNGTPSTASSSETLLQHPRQRNVGRNSTW